MQYDIAQKLAPFVPRTLLTDAHPVGKAVIVQGATLFADLSGFTHLTETLARTGNRGAESLSHALREIFTPLINVIHTHGGTISHFYGDAMLVYFLGDGATTVPQAFRCAAALQSTLQSLDKLHIDGNHVQLSLTCGIGYGALHSLVVAAAEQREFVLAGSSVDEATAAEKVGNHPIEVGATAKTFLRRQRVDPMRPLHLPKEFPAWLKDFVPTAIVERLSAVGAVTLAEHRPITSLFVRFEGLSAEDAHYATHLNNYFRWAVTLVNRYAKENGRVNRILTGDKGNQLHIILGAPTAPHAPAQALRLALAMQREKPSYITSQRIGVTTGRAFAVPLGSEQRREYTVIGNVVNLSARLCEACAPDETLCDPITASITEQSLQFEPQERISLKGIDTPIHPMRLIGIKENPAQLEARYGDSFGKPLNIHRDAFATLSAALQTGTRHITVTGEAGIGKSRLVAAVAEQWLARGGAGFVGACAPESAESPYTPWLAIVRALIDVPPTASPATQMERFHALFDALPSTDRTELQIDDSPLLFEAMGLPVQLSESLQKLNAKTKQTRLFRFIETSLNFFTRIQAHLFVFEDIHHADRASLDLIEFLVDSADLNLTFLVTTRSETDETTAPPKKPTSVPAGHLLPQGEGTRPESFGSPLPEGEGWGESSTTVRLQPLAAAETVAYVGELLTLDSQPLPEPLVSYFTRTGSHTTSATPLFLEEVVRAMWVNDVLRRVDGLLAVDEAQLAQLSLPNNVHAFLLARIDQLPHINRTILNVAAVIGSEFSGSLLQQVAPFAENSVERSLSSLQSAEFIRPIGNNTYLFQHGMTREAAYETLPFAERRKVHADVAGALERQFAGREREISAELARHHAHAEHRAKAVQHGKVAAQDAFELYANREALQLCNLCLQHIDETPIVETEILLLKAQIQLLLGDFVGATKSAEYAIEIGETAPPSLIYQGYVRLTTIAFQQGQYEQSLQQAYRLLAYLKAMQLDNAEELVIVYSRIAKALSALHRYDEALTHLQQAEQLCEKLNDDRRFAFVLDSMAHCYFLQHKLDEAANTMQRAVALARTTARDNEFVALQNNLALIYCVTGRYHESQATLAEALPRAQVASPRLYASTLSRQGTTYACLGDYQRAEASYQQAIQLLISMNDANRLLDVYLSMVEMLYLALNKIEDAQHYFMQAGEIIETQSRFEGESAIRWHIIAGCIALSQGEYATAATAFESAMQLIKLNKDRQWLTTVHLYQARMARQTGDIANATEQVRRGIEMSASAPEFLGALLLEKALLADLQPQRDVQLTEAVQQLLTRSRHVHRAAAHTHISMLINRGESELVATNIAPLITNGAIS